MTEDEQDVLVFALRYATGRHTFAPSTVAGVIGEHIHELGPRVRGVMITTLNGL